MSHRSFWRLAGVGVLTVLSLGSWPQRAWSEDQKGPVVCTTATTQHYNVVLFLLDDASMADFPFFNVPIQWQSNDSALISDTTVSGKDRLRDAQLRRPDFNRMAARLYADTDCDGGGCEFGKNFLHPSSTTKETKVLPIGFNSNADAVYYLERESNPLCRGAGDGCVAATDILSTHGGMQRLAREGAVFPRFYATSGRCTPTRASVLTGAHPRQVDVTDNGNNPSPKHIMIADYMKSLCYDGNDDTPCYTTGFVGKWHVGATEQPGQTTPWQRGNDEAVYFSAGSRKPWSSGRFQCGPPGQTLDVNRGFYCDDPGLRAATSSCTPGSDCVGMHALCMSPGQCMCANGALHDPAGANYCYQLNPPPCPTGSCANVENAAAGAVCSEWGQYVGRRKGKACDPVDAKVNPECCAPPPADDDDNDGGSVENVYEFNDKGGKNSTLAAKIPFWLVQGADGAPPALCRDDSHYDDTDQYPDHGCQYDTRFYRDMATNFLERHHGEKFFLEVSLHALHSVNDAPELTIAHERSTTGETKSKHPADPEKYWAVMEEVDAAIGSVLKTLDEKLVCSLDSTVATAGKACTSNATCGGGGTCEPLSKSTLVMMTIDQGRPGAGFGSPAYRDGKGSTHEGGIRVGLLAKIPGVTGNTATLGHNRLGSQVDLLPTIAEAAGCTPNGVGTGAFSYYACNDGKGDFCVPGANSPYPCDGGPSQCMPRQFTGRSLFSDLKNSGDPVRDAVYASYLGAPRIVATRQGYPVPGITDGKTGICGANLVHPATGSSADAIRFAGSCVRCATNSDCTHDCPANNPNCSPPPQEKCYADGKYCVSTTGSPSMKDKCKAGDGVFGRGDCDILATARRCSGTSPCQGTEACMEIEIPCTTCEAPQWKLLGSGGDDAYTSTGAVQTEKLVTPVALYDLTTNPTEKDKIEPKKYPQGPTLNCLSDFTPTTDTWDEDQRDKVVQHLCERLDIWTDCMIRKSDIPCPAGVNCDCDFPNASDVGNCVPESQW